MTATRPIELELTLTPRFRYDAIDVAARLRAEHQDVLARYPRALYCSFHTTAGYLEQSLSSRLDNRRERLDPFIRAFQELFPSGAAYRHDRLDLRDELSEEQRKVEPKNADSHLAFIGSGLRNCVTYTNRPGAPVYFMDLDGVDRGRVRTRRTRVVAYHQAWVVERVRCEVPVSRHPIDSINLADPRIGLVGRANALISRHGIRKGRVDIALGCAERDAGITVNEYETLLMRHDLAEVLADPLKFAARTGRRMLVDPRAIPAKSLGYARYDMVHVLNELMDALKVSETALERLLARVMAVPASRFLRMKRHVTLLVSDGHAPGEGAVTQGRYQNPILVQWATTPRRSREVELTLTSFE